ncbi:heat shock factor protein 2 [Patella vulgata]|uniref:heat shock factor protein 2 n=1 Tax=Patella vulgata TaxID=6465 RepID=UPI0021800D84|nr:heat shock factor protein 2 [Patella vulgata]
MSMTNSSHHLTVSPPRMRCDSMMYRFPARLWRIVNSCRTKAINWGPSGKTIRIIRTCFQEEYLKPATKPFKTQHFSSFIRQLNLYGFKKVTAPMCMTGESTDDYDDLYEYRHPLFRQNKSELLTYLHRNCKSKCDPRLIRQKIETINSPTKLRIRMPKRVSMNKRILSPVSVNTLNRDATTADQEDKNKSCNYVVCMRVVRSSAENVPKTQEQLKSHSSGSDVADNSLISRHIQNHPLLQPVTKAGPTLQVNPRLYQPLAPGPTTKTFTYGSTIFVPVASPQAPPIVTKVNYTCTNNVPPHQYPVNNGNIIEPCSMIMDGTPKTSSVILIDDKYDDTPSEHQDTKRYIESNTAKPYENWVESDIAHSIIGSNANLSGTNNSDLAERGVVMLNLSAQDQNQNTNSSIDNFNTSLNLDSFLVEHVRSQSEKVIMDDFCEMDTNSPPVDPDDDSQDKGDICLLNQYIEKHTNYEGDVNMVKATEPLNDTLRAKDSTETKELVENDVDPKDVNNVESTERYISIDISNLLSGNDASDKPCHLLQLDSDMLKLLRQTDKAPLDTVSVSAVDDCNNGILGYVILPPT